MEPMERVMTEEMKRNRIKACVKEFLQEQSGCFSELIDEEDLFVWYEPSEFEKYRIKVVVRENGYMVYTIFPIVAGFAVETRRKVAEYLSWLNCAYVNIVSEMDLTSGEVRFRTYVDCRDRLPNRNVLANSLMSGADLIRIYGRGIEMIVFEGKSTCDAFLEMSLLDGTWKGE